MNRFDHTHTYPRRFRAAAVSLNRAKPFLALCGTLLLLAGLLAGCSSSRPNQPELRPLPYDMPVDPPPGADMLTAHTYAGDALASMLLQRTGEGSGILVTSLVRLDTLDDNTDFGKLSAQQIASRIAQHGFMVMDIRLTQSLVINDRGEFMLSRDLGKLLAKDYNAHAVLVGTYTHSSNKIFVSVRALRLTDSAVIAAYEYYLPMNGDTAYLLGSQSGPGGSCDSAWKRYSSRGQSFSGGSSQAVSAGVSENRPVAAPAPVPSRPPQGGTSTSLGREYVAPARPPAGGALPEQVDVMSGGKRINPGSARQR